MTSPKHAPTRARPPAAPTPPFSDVPFSGVTCASDGDSYRVNAEPTQQRLQIQGLLPRISPIQGSEYESCRDEPAEPACGHAVASEVLF